MMWYFGLCFKPQGYYSGRMDASRKALKAGLQINNKAAMQVQAEAIVHPPVIYQSPCRWCKTSLSWQRAMLLESLWMLTLHCKDWDGYDVFFCCFFSVFSFTDRFFCDILMSWWMNTTGPMVGGLSAKSCSRGQLCHGITNSGAVTRLVSGTEGQLVFSPLRL